VINLIAAIIVIILVVIDQFTKYLATINLQGNPSVTLINGVLGLTYTENTGAAFGLFANWPMALTAFIVLAVIGIVVYYFKLPTTKNYLGLKLTLAVIVAGAIGNLIDRFLHGAVIDFIQFTFINFPVFNFADIFIVLGAIVMAYFVLFGLKDERAK